MSKSSSFNALIDRLARATSSPAGLDGGLQAISYGSPLVAAAILKFVQLSRDHPILSGVKGDGVALTNTAAGILKAAGSVAEARVVMRTFGMLPMINWLLKLHPNPVKALFSLIRSPRLSAFDLTNERVFSTVRVILLMGFYIGEHLSFLGSKGVISLRPEQIAKLSMWSIRSWTVDVFLTAIKMVHSYGALQNRTRILRAQTAQGVQVRDETEGYSLTEKEKDDVAADRVKLQAEWKTWEQQALVNFGWIPLTLHWNLGGLWENPLITAAIGSVVAYGKFKGAWNATA